MKKKVIFVFLALFAGVCRVCAETNGVAPQSAGVILVIKLVLTSDTVEFGVEKK